MTQWYYAKGGQQMGPVTFEELRGLAKSGALQPQDLVWNQSMKDWLPASSVSGVFDSSAVNPSSPYAAPQSSWTDEAPIGAGEGLPEIPYGSDPLDPVACIKRGFTLTMRHFATLLLIGVVYIAVFIAVNVSLEVMDHALGWGTYETNEITRIESSQDFMQTAEYTRQPSILNSLISWVASTFLGLGGIRVLLNLTSGKSASVADLFSGGPYLLRAMLSSILFGIAVFIGFLLLIVPGVYIALRYGYFMVAMVDRNLGVKESFQYASNLSTNNRLNIFVLGLLSLLVAIAGFLALCVGIFFALPVIYLAYIVAYRWLQYGQRAVLDHPGTNTPMLSGDASPPAA